MNKQDLLYPEDVPSDSLSRMWVDTRQNAKGFDLLDNLMRIKRTSNNALAVAVLGPPRWGKTTFVLEYLRRCEEGEGERKLLNFLFVELRQDTKPSSIAYETLCALDDPDPSYGKSEEKTSRTINAIKTGRYDLIVYDEAHYLVDSATPRVQANGVAWFNTLLNETRVPMLLVGYERVRDVLRRNESLAGRMLPFPPLRQFDHAVPEDLEEFRHVLGRLEPYLGFPTPSGLDETGVAARLCYFCRGRFGLLEMFLTHARELARSRRHSCITPEVLRETAADSAGNWAKHPFNPFEVEDLAKAIQASGGVRTGGDGRHR